MKAQFQRSPLASSSSTPNPVYGEVKARWEANKGDLTQGNIFEANVHTAGQVKYGDLLFKTPMFFKGLILVDIYVQLHRGKGSRRTYVGLQPFRIHLKSSRPMGYRPSRFGGDTTQALNFVIPLMEEDKHDAEAKGAIERLCNYAQRFIVEDPYIRSKLDGWEPALSDISSSFTSPIAHQPTGEGIKVKWEEKKGYLTGLLYDKRDGVEMKDGQPPLAHPETLRKDFDLIDGTLDVAKLWINPRQRSCGITMHARALQTRTNNDMVELREEPEEEGPSVPICGFN